MAQNSPKHDKTLSFDLKVSMGKDNSDFNICTRLSIQQTTLIWLTDLVTDPLKDNLFIGL